MWKFCSKKPEPEPEVSAHGILDIFSLFDKETIDRVKEVIDSIEPEKIKAVMKMIEPENGEIKLKIDLRVSK